MLARKLARNRNTFRLALEPLEDRSLPSVYAVTDLGTLGGTYSYATAINSSGQIAGFSYMPGNDVTHAFLWQNGVMSDLGTLPGGMHSFAYGINDAGQIVGASYMPDGTLKGVLWDHGAITNLGTLGGSSSQANAINNHGQIVGWAAALPDDLPHAFLWDDGVMTDLGKLTGDVSSAYGINDHGQAAGYSDTIPGQFSPHATLWDSEGMHDLGTLPGGAGSTGLGINQYGQVIGKAKVAAVDDSHYAFLWDNGEMKSLGGLPLSRGSAGQGINRFAQVVGTSTIHFKAHAYVYFNGKMFNLNDVYPKSQSGWFYSVATAVGDNGEIIGSGYGPNGQHAFLLKPINPGPVSTLQITGMSTPVQAGTSYTFTVAAKDIYGDTVPNFTGTVSFNSSDSKAQLPASYTFTEADGGMRKFTVVFKTSRQQSIFVSDSFGTIPSAAKQLVVKPGPATTFSIVNLSSPIFVGSPSTFLIAAVDSYGNVVRDYEGTVSFSSTDSNATLPATYTFTKSDYGVQQLTVVFWTAGTHSLLVSDTVAEGISGKLDRIVVSPPRSTPFIRNVAPRIVLRTMRNSR